MNRNQRGRIKKQKDLGTEKSASDSSCTGRTEEMVVIPKETFLEMEEKLKILAESKLIYLLLVPTIRLFNGRISYIVLYRQHSLHN